ncbi:BGTF surface domain-containing protein [Halosimplex halophilum]|uniref:BGTF surface domain-containing protein n=1 Tax=Halosimplex halophilum TaxID=2559572 RepID=UPI00107F5511|nr:BGTF surface domain-containing protein [Halosimplex halophilum]
MTGAGRPFRRVAAVAFAAALCLPGVALGAPVAPGDTAADSHVAIEEDAVEQADGDVAEFTLAVPRGESVAVVVTGPGGDRRLTLTDASGDGRVALALNSYVAGPGVTAAEVYDIGEGDRLSADDATGRLPAGTYRVAAYANDTGGEPADTAGLTLADPGLGNATVMVAPNGSRERLDSPAAIRRAQDRRWLTPADEVAVGDTFVLRLTVPGVAGAVANESGATDEARFRRLLAGPNASLLLSERMPGPSRLRQHLSLAAANVTTVAAEPANDTYYVAADLTALPRDYGELHEVGGWTFGEPHLIDGNDYVPRFVVDDEHRLNPSDLYEGWRTGRFFVVQPDATVTFPTEEDGTVAVAPAPNRTVAGWTNLAPGSTVTIRLSNAESDPFPLTETVRVARERPPGAEGAVYRFRAEFDLGGVAPGTTFDIEIRSNGTRLDPRDSWDDGYRGYVDPALVVADRSTPTASPTTSATPTDTAASASPTASPTPTAPSTTTASGTPPGDPATTPTRTASPTAETTAVDGPGFGAVGALLGALALAALGARRSGRRSP